MAALRTPMVALQFHVKSDRSVLSNSYLRFYWYENSSPYPEPSSLFDVTGAFRPTLLAFALPVPSSPSSFFPFLGSPLILSLSSFRRLRYQSPICRYSCRPNNSRGWARKISKQQGQTPRHIDVLGDSSASNTPQAWPVLFRASCAAKLDAI